MLIALSALLACNSSNTDEPAITYYDHVQPIMAQHCTRCHSDSGLGVGDFTDRETVERMSDLINSAMASGTMPPPTSDPECRDYVGSEHVNVSPDTKAIFERWLDGGKLTGEVRPFPQTLLRSEIEDPDVRIAMEEPFVPTYSREEELGNEYRCFVLDTTTLEGKYITEVGSKVLSTKQMHHITLSFVDKEDVVGEQYFDPQGWDCIDTGNSGFPSDRIFAGFAPGSAPLKFPEGSGFFMDPSHYIVMSMHYVWDQDADGEADQTEMQFNVEDEVDTELFMVTLGVEGFSIPPNSVSHSDSQVIPVSLFPEFDTFKIHSVLPHMHQLGTEFEMVVSHADGSETCGLSGDYSFDNQIGYLFREPIDIQPNDLITLSCIWDNPTDQTVTFGERTDEEMCLFFAMIEFRARSN